MSFPSTLLVPASMLGLGFSILWHIGALLGAPAASIDAGMSMPVFAGVFVVWVPTLWRLRKLNAAMQSWNGLWIALEGLESWTKRALVGLFVYAIANFFRGFLQSQHAAPGDTLEFSRIASGHAMLFYAAAAALNRAHDRRIELGIWRCPKGHDVSPTAKFCEECGATIMKRARPR